MTHMYFDESIRINGGFIVGALVVSSENLSLQVENAWRELGLNPTASEFKSSRLKFNDSVGQLQRDLLRNLLRTASLALVVCPTSARKELGDYCSQLVSQLDDVAATVTRPCELFIDEGIVMSTGYKKSLHERNIVVNDNQDSRFQFGIQLADYAAHSLGSMLLSEMGVISKKLTFGAEVGFEPAIEADLGFELWANLRQSLIGRMEADFDAEDVSGAWEPTRIVDGIGLLVAPSCSAELASAVRSCFGTMYIGCIH